MKTIAATILCILLAIGVLALLCCVFAPELDRFDRGESPCCNVLCFGVLLIGTLAALSARCS